MPAIKSLVNVLIFLFWDSLSVNHYSQKSPFYELPPIKINLSCGLMATTFRAFKAPYDQGSQPHRSPSSWGLLPQISPCSPQDHLVIILSTINYIFNYSQPELPDWPLLWSNFKSPTDYFRALAAKACCGQNHNILRSQRGYSRPEAAIFHCVPRPQSGSRIAWLVIFCGQINLTNGSFAAPGCHSSLWPKVTTFLR